MSSNPEIRAARKELDEAQEDVVEDLTSLIVLYLETRDRHAVEKTRGELYEIEKEFCKVQESVQEYLDANKDELSSQFKRQDFPGNSIICIHKKRKLASA